MNSHHRKNIYYWKSDRVYAVGNVQSADRPTTDLEPLVYNYLIRFFKPQLLKLRPGGGQGNHITFQALYASQTYFVRIENGPEHDDYMNVESEVLTQVNAIGIPSPKVYHSDNSRSHVPFAIQVIEYIESRDLNVLEKEGGLNLLLIGRSVGEYVAKWQDITPKNFGLFNPQVLAESDELTGYHENYRDYFFLNWDRHLNFLEEKGFLSSQQTSGIRSLVDRHDHLLNIERGCLVHKDLALWNILGSTDEIHAFIDWSDTISGDPMDDLALLGCFHSGDMLQAALSGYADVRPLPDQYEQRFWLHLLRNIIFKAVIRVQGNYFDKPDSFFMNNSASGDLRQFTLDRIEGACAGLRGDLKINDL